jgi:eukaryotic-like serine/threonine-protein kinase
MSRHLGHGLPPPEQPPDEVEVLARRFLAQLQAGENPDRQALLRAHPHLAARLERRLALVEMAYRVGLAPHEDSGSLAETMNQTGFAGGDSASQAPTRVATGAADGPRGRLPSLPDYELLGELGHGGMGVVYKARQISLNRVVALKMIPAGALASPQLRARFQVEAEAVASLQHPNIVQVYEVGEYDFCPYLAMEFVDGGNLYEYLAGEPPPPPAAAELVETLARAIHRAHQRGIVHRDLKPANILLGRDPDGAGTLHLIPKITDFGLAKRLAEGKGQTATGAIMGTPSYMAPEQASGRVREIGPPTDVYALGAILYEMVTGQPPFQGETELDTIKRVMSEEPAAPCRLRPKLPRDLETICLKCLEKEPARRYASAESLADDLRRFLNGEPITARPAGRVERAWKWAKRRPALATLFAVILGTAVVLTGSLTWSYARVLDERDRQRQNLRVARQAIDYLYNKMDSEGLFDEPQLDPFCQEFLEKAQELYKDLAQGHSNDAGVRHDIAQAWSRLGDIQRMRDQHDAAQKAYGEAISRQEELRRDYPQEPRYREDLANSHNWLGESLREQGRPPDEAEGHYRTALGLQQELIRAGGSEPNYCMELARSHYNLGIIERETGRLLEAHADYGRAVVLLTELHRAQPSEPRFRQGLARAFINRGVLHRLSGRPAEAGQDYDQAIDLLARLHEEIPGRAIYKYELAIARQDSGNLLWSQRRQPEAQREHEKALTLLRELLADFSNRPRYQKKKGSVLKDLGTVLVSAGDRAGGEQCWNQARTLFETLARKSPAVADYQALLGMTLGNLGWLRTEQKNWPEARRLIEQGIEHMRASLQPNPKHPDYRQELRNQYRDLAWTLLQLGDHAAAVQAATNMAELFPEQAQYRYFAACFIARAVPLAKDDQLAGQYVGQAVRLLRQVAAQAPPNLERIADEKQVFQGLSGHPDFAQALRALNAKAPAAGARTGP